MRYCCFCDRLIRGAYRTIIVHSASAARPDKYAHPDPAQCRRKAAR